jgi:thiol:disulfide interchange protein DsbA
MNLIKMNLNKTNLFDTNLFNKIVMLVLLLSTSFSALASLDKPVSGKEYQVLAKAQPTDSKDKVEVIEFFFYTCPHCNVLDPYLSAWVKKQGSAISFKRVPVVFSGDKRLEILAKMYYTLEAMGKLDAVHPKIFEAIHVKRLPLSDDTQIFNFVAANGVDKKKFEEIYNSFSTPLKLKRAQALQNTYNVDSVPMLIVDGRYMTSPGLIMQTNPSLTEAQSEQGLMQVLSTLVSKVEKERKTAPAPKETKAVTKEVTKEQPVKK